MKTTTAIIVATLYLLAFIISIQLQVSQRLMYGLFTFSPLVLIWLAVVIIRDKSERYPERRDDQEWGYFHK